MNARNHDIHDAADGALRTQALEALVDQLAAGRAVHTITSRDIFDCLIDDVRRPAYAVVLDILDDVLALNGKCGDEHKRATYEIQEKTKALVTGFVEGAHPDWIQEKAEEIEAEVGDPADERRAVAEPI